MPDLPLTTDSDLRKLGLTPEKLRDLFLSRGRQIPGTLNGFFLPPDQYDKYDRIKRARNTVLCGWTEVQANPSTPLDTHVYSQGFENFESNKETTTRFNNSVSVTTGEEYSLTQSWDINVNESLNLGEIGHVGFSASVSEQDVHSRSYTKTDTHSVDFDVEVPAHEGRLVTETTVETKVDAVFEARIGPTGSVGIQTKNPYRWFLFYNIENIYPDLYQVGRIVRGTIDTHVNTAITELRKPNSKNAKPRLGKMLSCTIHRAPSRPTADTMLQIAASGPLPSLRSTRTGYTLVEEVELLIHFDATRDLARRVPANQRVGKCRTLRDSIENENQLHGVLQQMESWQYRPSVQDILVASLVMHCDTTQKSEPEIMEIIRQLATMHSWGGQVRVAFE